MLRLTKGHWGRDARSWHWDFARWDRDERKVLDAGEALAWDPEEVAIEVTPRGTG